MGKALGAMALTAPLAVKVGVAGGGPLGALGVQAVSGVVGSVVGKTAVETMFFAPAPPKQPMPINDNGMVITPSDNLRYNSGPAPLLK